MKLLIFLIFIPAFYALAESRSFVKIRSFSQQIDEKSPWSQLPVSEANYIGIVVKGGDILVSSQAVSSAQYLEVETLESSEAYQADVIRVDYNAQLALLKTRKKVSGLKPVQFGSDLKRGDRVEILTLKEKSLIPLKSTFRELKIRSSLTANYNLPHFSFDVKSRGVGWSEPIIKAKRLVGISVRKEQNQIFALPISVVKRFLSSSGEKSSFGRLGIRYERLSSRHLRTILGLSKKQEGVWISEVSPQSPLYQKLQNGDVLLKIGKFNISGTGMVHDSFWGKIPMSGIVYRYPAGRTFGVKVWRNKKELSFKVDMKTYDSTKDFVPFLSGGQRNYLIYGGFIFQELTKNYLQSWGSSWLRKSPMKLLHRYLYDKSLPPAGKQSRLVFISKVLVDDINKGYESISNYEVLQVNGKKIDSIKSLKEVLGQPEIKGDGHFTRITLGPINKEVIIDHKDILVAQERISKVYSIPSNAFWIGAN